MPNQVRVGVGVTGAKGAASDLDKLRDKFSKLQQQGAKGLAIGAGVSLTNKALGLMEGAVSGVTGAVFDSIRAASDLNEQMTKSERVFGDASGAMDAFASGAARNLGLSKRAALEASGAFGQFFEGAGQSAKNAEYMSEKIVTLGADLASFNNIDPTDALDKLRSGLSGEAKPLREVGVFLTEASVKAKAMQMGLGNAHGELTEGEKILARYELILEQTTKAQGDFARTSDGLANQERRNSALLENAQARIGANFEKLAQDAATGAALVLDQQFADEVAYQNNRVGLAQKTNDELRRIEASTLQGGQEEMKRRIAADILFERAGGRAADSLGELRYAFIGADNASSDYADAIKAAGGAVDDTTSAVQELSDAEKANIAETKRVVGVLDYLDTAASKLPDKFKAFENALFGKAQQRGDLAQARKDISDLLAVEPKKSTRDWTIWRGELAKADQALFDLQYQAKQTEGPEALDKWLRAQKKSFGNANAVARDYLNTLIALNSLKLGPAARAALTRISGVTGSQHPGGYGGKQFAEGGHYEAGVPRMVGEKGIEVDIPDHSGTIIPNKALGGMGGITINLTVAAPSGTDGRRWGQDVADSIAGSLRQQSARLPVGAGA